MKGSIGGKGDNRQKTGYANMGLYPWPTIQNMAMEWESDWITNIEHWHVQIVWFFSNKYAKIYFDR